MQISGCRNRLFLHLGSWIYVWSQCAINLQQDKCYSPFCSLLSLYKWKSVILLKVIALRMGYSVYFRLYIYIFFFNKRCRANISKHWQQSISLKGTESIWSQGSSLLQYLCKGRKETLICSKKKNRMLERLVEKVFSLIKYMRFNPKYLGGTSGKEPKLPMQEI